MQYFTFRFNQYALNAVKDDLGGVLGGDDTIGKSISTIPSENSIRVAWLALGSDFSAFGGGNQG